MSEALPPLHSQTLKFFGGKQVFNQGSMIPTHWPVSGSPAALVLLAKIRCCSRKLPVAWSRVNGEVKDFFSAEMGF